MWDRTRLFLRVAACHLVALAAAATLGEPVARAGDPLSLREVRARIREQSSEIESLHIRVRRKTTIPFDAALAASWRSRPTDRGTDEVQFAFKGNNRYWRILALDYQPARAAGASTEERDGRRIEIRRDSKLAVVIVDTQRWRFRWEIEPNRVIASPSPLCMEKHDAYDPAPGLIADQRTLIRTFEPLTGVPACTTERLDGREVNKMTVHFPPDSVFPWKPTHGAPLPENLLLHSGTEFRRRVYWFDPETHLMLQRHCGCKRPHPADPNAAFWNAKIDYPAPGSIPEESLGFRVPRDALLEINDPALGRQVYSEGTTLPDLRRR